MDPKRVLDQMPVGIWVGSLPDGATVYANQAYEDILGRPAAAGATSATGLASTFDRKGRPYPVEKLPFSVVASTGKDCIVGDMVVHHPDGRHVPIRAFAQPVLDDQGRPTRVSVAFFDITHELEVERERETMQDRLSLVIHHAPAAVWAADTNGVVTLSEGAGLRAMGIESGQLVGQSLFELYRDHPDIPKYIRQALAGKSFWYTVEAVGVTYDTWITPLLGDNGEITGVAAVSNDVTEVRKLQTAAIQNDRIMALGTLAASMAHEINNPLTYVLHHIESCAAHLETLSQLAARGDASPAVTQQAVERIRDHLDPVLRGTQRIATITRELRTFSSPMERDVGPVDLQAVVRSALQLVGKELDARAKLEIDLRQTGLVRGNEARLVQVALNLLMNAMQALEGRERELNAVVVRTYNEDNRVVIEVADTGPGIPEAIRARIFEPFFTTKEIAHGTGLGLFVCRNIVQSLSGEISVGDNPGGGALFRVTLPHAAPETDGGGDAAQDGAVVSNAHASALTSAKMHTRRILVIDDEPMVADVLCERLRRAGYDVRAVHDGSEALDIILAEDDLDLVFCDLMMKGMTGMDLAAALAQKKPGKPQRIVFMTGGAFTPAARAFVEANAEISVDKPFDVVAEAARRLPA